MADGAAAALHPTTELATVVILPPGGEHPWLDLNAGLAAARSGGRIGGRPEVNAEAIVHAKAMIKGGMSTSQAAKLAGISRSTLYRTAMA